MPSAGMAFIARMITTVVRSMQQTLLDGLNRVPLLVRAFILVCLLFAFSAAARAAGVDGLAHSTGAIARIGFYLIATLWIMQIMWRMGTRR